MVRGNVTHIDVTFGSALGPAKFHRVTDAKGEAAPVCRAHCQTHAFLWAKSERGTAPITSVVIVPVDSTALPHGATQKAALVEAAKHLPAEHELLPKNLTRGTKFFTFLAFRRGRDAAPLKDLRVEYGPVPSSGGAAAATGESSAGPVFVRAAVPLSGSSMPAADTSFLSLRWRRPEDESEEFNASRLKRGEWVDCLDQSNRWCVCRVVSTTATTVRVHYKGTSERLDEDVPISADRLAPMGEFSSTQAGGVQRRTLGLAWDVTVEDVESILRQLSAAEAGTMAPEEVDFFWKGDLVAFLDEVFTRTFVNAPAVLPRIHELLHALLDVAIRGLQSTQPLKAEVKLALRRIFYADEKFNYYYAEVGPSYPRNEKRKHFDAIPYTEDTLETLLGSRAFAVPAMDRQIAASLMLHLNHFGDRGGFDAMLERLARPEPPISFEEANLLITMLFSVARVLEPAFSAGFFPRFTELVFRRIAQVSERELKDLDKGSVEAVINSMFVLLPVVLPSFDHKLACDQAQLGLSVRLITSSFLAKRTEGLGMLSKFIDKVEDLELSTMPATVDPDAVRSTGTRNTGKRGGDSLGGFWGSGGGASRSKARGVPSAVPLADFIAEVERANLLSFLITPSCHVEVVRRSVDLLRFLARHGRLTPAHIDQLIETSKLGEPEMRAVFQVLQDLCPRMPMAIVRHTFDAVRSATAASLSDPIIATIVECTKRGLFLSAAPAAAVGGATAGDTATAGDAQAGASEEGRELFGIPVLWSSSRDQRLAPAVRQSCQSAFIDLLKEVPDAQTQFVRYLGMCARAIAAGENVADSVALAQRLLARLLEGANTKQSVRDLVQRTLQMVEEQHGLLSSVTSQANVLIPTLLRALGAGAESADEAEKLRAQLASQLDLAATLCTEALPVTAAHVVPLFQHVSAPSGSPRTPAQATVSDMLYDWIFQLTSSLRSASMSDKDRRTIFRAAFENMGTSSVDVTPASLRSFITFFALVNSAKLGPPRSFRLASAADLVMHRDLWRAAARAQTDQLFQDASDFLVRVYSHATTAAAAAESIAAFIKEHNELTCTMLGALSRGANVELASRMCENLTRLLSRFISYVGELSTPVGRNADMYERPGPGEVLVNVSVRTPRVQSRPLPVRLDLMMPRSAMLSELRALVAQRLGIKPTFTRLGTYHHGNLSGIIDSLELGLFANQYSSIYVDVTVSSAPEPDLADFYHPYMLCNVDKTIPKLPGTLLAGSDESFDMLLRILGCGNSAAAQEAWKLLQQLPPNPRMTERVTSAFGLLADPAQAVNWSVELPADNQARLLYLLHLMAGHLTPTLVDDAELLELNRGALGMTVSQAAQREERERIAAAHAQRRRWCDAFSRGGGYAHLTSLLCDSPVEQLTGTPLRVRTLSALLRTLSAVAMDSAEETLDRAAVILASPTLDTSVPMAAMSPISSFLPADAADRIGAALRRLLLAVLDPEARVAAGGVAQPEQAMRLSGVQQDKAATSTRKGRQHGEMFKDEDDDVQASSKQGTGAGAGAGAAGAAAAAAAGGGSSSAAEDAAAAVDDARATIKPLAQAELDANVLAATITSAFRLASHLGDDGVCGAKLACDPQVLRTLLDTMTGAPSKVLRGAVGASLLELHETTQMGSSSGRGASTQALEMLIRQRIPPSQPVPADLTERVMWSLRSDLDRLSSGLRKLGMADPGSAMLSAMLRKLTSMSKDSVDMCREFFALLRILLDSAHDLDVDEVTLVSNLTQQLREHDVVEVTHEDQDVVLRGLLAVLQAVLSKPSAAALRERCGELLDEIFHNCLFSPPSGEVRGKPAPPKAKHPVSRKMAFGVMLALTKGCPTNMLKLAKLIAPHHAEEEDELAGGESTALASASSAPPALRLKRQGSGGKLGLVGARAASGYVGLRNLGCICYMNSSLQQFFMMPEFRQGVLEVSDYGSSTDASSAQALEENVVFQLQRMFANLQESEKQSYNPRPFCMAFKDFEGNPVNVVVQQDASEFLTQFFQHIESTTSGTEHDGLLRSSVCGELCNELIATSSGGQPLYSQRREPFYFLSVQVKDRKNLGESLDGFVQPDTVEYSWDLEEGKKEKVNTMKRCFISRLPKYLVVHLKRFEFDMDTFQQAKINDRFEFPRELDMRAFTIPSDQARQHAAAAAAAAAAAEAGDAPAKAPETPSGADAAQTAGSPGADAAGDLAGDKAGSGASGGEPEESTKYRLSGIVIHYGTANSGHYYSFIRERTSRGRWFEFNDAHVSPFDPDEIESEAFGGAEGTGAAALAKIKSAFILVYDRVTDESLPESVDVDVSSMPAIIAEEVTRENQRFWRERNIINAQYFAFMMQFIEQSLGASPAEATAASSSLASYPAEGTVRQLAVAADDVGMQMVQLATNFLSRTLPSSSLRINMQLWLDLQGRLLQSNLRACALAMQAVVPNERTVSALRALLLEQDSLEVRSSSASQLAASLRVLGAAEMSFLSPSAEFGVIARLPQDALCAGTAADSPAALEAALRSVCPGRFSQMPVAVRAVHSLATLIPELPAFPRSYGEVVRVLLAFAQSGSDAAAFLVRNGVLGALIDLLLGPKTKLLTLRSATEPQCAAALSALESTKGDVAAAGAAAAARFAMPPAVGGYEEQGSRRQRGAASAKPAPGTGHASIVTQAGRPHLITVLELISTLARSCVPPSGTRPPSLPASAPQLSEEDAVMLASPDLLAIILSELQFVASDSMRHVSGMLVPMLQHIAWGSAELSEMLAAAVAASLKTAFEDRFKSIIGILWQICAVDDGMRAQRVGISIKALLAAARESAHVFKDTLRVLMLLVRYAHANADAKAWMLANPAEWQWAIEWLEKNPTPPGMYSASGDKLRATAVNKTGFAGKYSYYGYVQDDAATVASTLFKYQRLSAQGETLSGYESDSPLSDLVGCIVRVVAYSGARTEGEVVSVNGGKVFYLPTSGFTTDRRSFLADTDSWTLIMTREERAARAAVAASSAAPAAGESAETAATTSTATTAGEEAQREGEGEGGAVGDGDVADVEAQGFEQESGFADDGGKDDELYDMKGDDEDYDDEEDDDSYVRDDESDKARS